VELPFDRVDVDAILNGGVCADARMQDAVNELVMIRHLLEEDDDDDREEDA
jgi:hypothetical protein